MNLTHTKAPVYHRVMGGLLARLPHRVKRMIFVASLAKTISAQGVSDEMLRKLNAIMQLSGDDAALRLPLELANVIWRGRGSEEICKDAIECQTMSDAKFDRFVSSVKSNTRPWLRYGEDAMRSDLHSLIRVRQMGAV